MSKLPGQEVSVVGQLSATGSESFLFERFFLADMKDKGANQHVVQTVLPSVDD